MLAGGLAAVAAIVAALGVLALAQRDNAREERAGAQRQAAEATSLALAVSAAEPLATRPDISLGLAFEAYRTAPRAEARSAVVRALSAVRKSRTRDVLPMANIVDDVAFGRDDRLLVLSGVTREQVHHLEPAHRIRRHHADRRGGLIAIRQVRRVERDRAAHVRPPRARLRQAEQQVVLEALVQRQHEIGAEAARLGDRDEIVFERGPLLDFRQRDRRPRIRQQRRRVGLHRVGLRHLRDLDQRGVVFDPRLLRAARDLQHAVLVRHPVGSDVRPLAALFERPHGDAARLQPQPQLRELRARRRALDDHARHAPGRRRERRERRCVDFEDHRVALFERALRGGLVLRGNDERGDAEAVGRRRLIAIPPDQHFRPGIRGQHEAAQE